MIRVVRQIPIPIPDLTPPLVPTLPAVWLDIETTGFSPQLAQVSSIGYLFSDVTGRQLVQLFADVPSEEEHVLRSAFAELAQTGTLITYNGYRFDVPFLIYRGRSYGLHLPNLLHRDLLVAVQRWDRQRRVLPDHRLQSVMQHFQLARQDHSGGYAMVAAYASWLERQRDEDRQFILDHNADDLLLMPELTDGSGNSW